MTSPLYFSVVIPPAHTCLVATEWHAPGTCTRGAFKTPLEANQWAQSKLRGNAYTVAPCRVLESRKVSGKETDHAYHDEARIRRFERS